MYTPFLAWRYLRSLWLTWLAVGMVATGVLAMTVILSVMWGLEEFTRSRMRVTFSDVEILRPRSLPIEDYSRLCQAARQAPGVEAAWPVVEGTAVLRNGGWSRGVRVQGLDFSDPAAVLNLRSFLKAAGSSWPAPPGGTPVFPGARVDAGSEGDEIDLFVAANSPSYSPTPTSPSVNRIPARLAGRFLARSYFDDDWGVFVPLEAAQRLFRFNHPPTVNRIHVRLAPGEDDRKAARILSDLLGGDFRARPWSELGEQQVLMLKTENQIIAVILAALVVLAGFGILAVLNMQVTHKLTEIGILKALGGTRGGIAGIFLLSSTAIGAAGTAAALAVGIPLLTHIDTVWGWISSEPFYMTEAYGTEGIPVDLRPHSIAAIAVGAVLVSALAGAWPAWRATRLHPAEALRNG